jgi:hypothetical protein
MKKEIRAMSTSSDASRELLRHAVATVAYRSGKALRGAPESFAVFSCGENPRAAEKILAHMGDLFDWALSMARGEAAWKDSQPLAWNKEVDRFFGTLRKFDDYLASAEPLHHSVEKIFQGPVADALTHIGQLAMMRRLAGCSMKGENYFKAEIVAGRVGSEQTAPRREF